MTHGLVYAPTPIPGLKPLSEQSWCQKNPSTNKAEVPGQNIISHCKEISLRGFLYPEKVDRDGKIETTKRSDGRNEH